MFLFKIYTLKTVHINFLRDTSLLFVAILSLSKFPQK